MCIQKDFIDYWDEVIKIWLKGDKGVLQDALRGKDECYYKDGRTSPLDVHLEEEQSHWFKDESLRKLLCPIHMPEPYWGDPKECSIVIVDYNPAGGKDMSPHTYRGRGEPYPENTMIKYVLENKYSKLALDFPLLHTKADLENDSRWWLRSYGGRIWWRSKIEWMLHLIQQVSEPPKEWPKEVFRPFAIELCGWHSPNWPDNTNAIDNNGDLEKTIRNRFVTPLLHSIDFSTSKLAVCIGAQFKPDILGKYIGPAFKKVTESVFDELPIHKIPEYTISYPSKDGSICVSVKTGKKDKAGKEEEKTRYYRVYDIETDEHHIILNTFAPGGNHHPARHFWPFEDILIEAIRNTYPIKQLP